MLHAWHMHAWASCQCKAEITCNAEWQKIQRAFRKRVLSVLPFHDFGCLGPSRRSLGAISEEMLKQVLTHVWICFGFGVV